MYFDNFISNDNVKAALMAAFTKDRLPQAIILEGGNGVGKKTLAKLIAQIAVCTSENKPCGYCNSCIMASGGYHPDIKIEEGSGVSESISVETIRNITQDVYKKAEFSDYNIYLLFVKNQLSSSSQNKLLKIIEEPPSNALFIITVNSAQSLLPTIISRATIFTLQNPPVEEAAIFFMKEKNCSYEEAIQIAENYNGNIGKMLAGDVESAQIAISIAEIFDKSDYDALLATTYPLISNKKLFISVLTDLRLILRDAYNYDMGTGDCIGVSKEQSKRIGMAYRKKILLEFPEICTKYLDLAQKNINMSLLVTDFCAKLRYKALK
ncbi:MAG: hypothetical protein R3Y35_02085 [Clostridia bacterium]